MTRGRSGVVSMITTFSGAAVRRLTSEAGKFSELQYQRPSPACRMCPSSRDEREEVVDRPGTEHVAGLERALERGAAQVGEQHVEVVRVDPRLLGRALEEELRVVDDVLVDRRAGRDEDPDARLEPATGPPELLPRRRDRARVAGEHRDVQGADVDAELERVRRDDAEDLAVAQAALDRAALGRQVAAAIAADPRSRPEILAERLADAGQEDLDRDPRPPEHDRLAARPEERQRPALRMGERRAPRARRRVEQRRIDEQDVLRARRRAVAVDEPWRPTGELRGELGRVPDRRGRAHDDRVRAVVSAQAEQPAQDVRDVAAEHAAVGVQLVDDDDPDLLEELEPLRVMREDRGVEHVRVRDHDLPGRADGRPDRRRRVAVVRRRRDRERARPGELGELRDLVLAERLRREEEERARRRVLRQRLQDRQRVAQRLARGGRRDDDDVLAGMDRLDGLRLVAVQRGDPAVLQPADDARVQPRRERRGDRLARGEAGVVR